MALTKLREEELEKAKKEATALEKEKAEALARLQESDEGAKRLMSRVTALEAEKEQMAAASEVQEEKYRALVGQVEALQQQLAEKDEQLRVAETSGATTPTPSSARDLPQVEVKVTTHGGSVAMPARYAKEEANHDARLSRG